jgi:hypothetical protein
VNFVIHAEAVDRCIAFVKFHTLLLSALVHNRTGGGPHGRLKIKAARTPTAMTLVKGFTGRLIAR